MTKIHDGLTFDDVLMIPAASEVMPASVNVRTRLTKTITLNIPLISAAMDTVTEAPLAIAIAQMGGIGVLHRNMEIDEQVEMVRQVKRYEAGMVVNPVTMHPDETLRDALDLMATKKISGLPIVERGGDTGKGKLVGVLTNRDVRFAEELDQPISELMTKEGLITVTEGVSSEDARKLLHLHRIEKLIVVDDAFNCIGLITVKDMEKSTAHPEAAKPSGCPSRGVANVPRIYRERTSRCRQLLHLINQLPIQQSAMWPVCDGMVTCLSDGR